MSSVADTPAITGQLITRFGGRTLTYAELRAWEKREYLFEVGIRATAYADNALPDVRLGIPEFAASAFQSLTHHLLGQTLTRTGDELEVPKRKLFHTYGTTAQVRFVAQPGTPYTGLFADEALGLARFSYAGPALGVGIVPGLGLKLFVDGPHASPSAVLMRMLDGQQQSSVFEHVFTNRLPPPAPTNAIMRLVNARFETVVTPGRGLHQPVDHLAAVRTDGQVVGEVRAPYRLLLVPTEAARAASDPTLDFRLDLSRNVPVGTVVYQVWALDEAGEARLREAGVDRVEDLLPHSQQIGSIVTDSEFVASAYGDFRLFFKHSDVYLRPELQRPAGT